MGATDPANAVIASRSDRFDPDDGDPKRGIGAGKPAKLLAKIDRAALVHGDPPLPLILMIPRL